MLKLFRRFSLRQKLIVGFFFLIALIATPITFWVDETVMIVALFWLLAVAVFVMVMLVRRLNAKISRVARLSRSKVVKKNKNSSRANSALPLEQLQHNFRQKRSASNAIALARALLREQGAISDAKLILDEVSNESALEGTDKQFVRRVSSLSKYLHENLELPKRHYSYNYVPTQNKVLYAVGMSPLSVSNGYTSRTHGVVAGLVSQELEVVVAPLPGKPWDKGPQPGYRIPKERRRYIRYVDGVRYVHNPGVPAWGGDLDIFFQVSADAYVREALIEKPEFILASSNYLSALPALIAARRLGIPFVYEMRGFWEVSAASVNPGWEQSDQYRLDRRFEDFVAHEADRVVVITEEMRDDLASRGIDSTKISVAPNSVDTDSFSPRGKDWSLLKRLGFNQPDLPVIGFAGSITKYEGLDDVVNALADLDQQGFEFNLLIIGEGNYLPEIKALVSKLNLDHRTRYISGVPNSEMPVYLSSIDIFPLARKSLPVTELVSPIKPLEAMAVGGVVVLSDVSPHRIYFEGEDTRALGFRKNDLASLTESLRKLLNLSYDQRRSMGARARRWIKENRRWQHVGETFRTVFEYARAAQDAGSRLDNEHSLQSFTVAFIGDTFTSDTFLPDLTAIQVLPDNWRALYAEHSVDALFIESAWMGNDGAWHGIVGYYDDESHAPLVELIEHSRGLGIPVLFWNKEDPVHFNRFKRTAALCDYVFTTDARTIVDYNNLPNNVIRTVASLPFSAQPLLHNPVPSTRDKQEEIAYGGTYYGDKYATRKQGLDFLFYEAAPHGLAIYERVHNDPNSPYRLPDRFRRYARPSLSYPEMCQAYKAHPIHLNGNSVVDSPSMFSRRVVEIAASGASVLSSAGRGVDETMAGTIPTVNTPDEANLILEGWKASEQDRHRELWNALRHVYQAHTTEHRLTYMLRVAGLAVVSPRLPKFAVECASSDIELFERQAIRPDLYLVKDSGEVQFSRVPAIYVSVHERPQIVSSYGIDYVIRTRESLGTLGQHDVGDLLNATRFGDWEAVGKRVVRWNAGDPFVPIASLSADINDQIVLYDARVFASLATDVEVVLEDENVFAWQVVLDATAEGPSKDRQQPVSQEKSYLTVLLAGHDFKFFAEISRAISNAGHKILIDHWDNHDLHDEEASRSMLAEADVIFCEWSLGNVRWYSQNKLPGQRLITRFHAQELRTKFLDDAHIDNIDKFIFVSPAGMRRAQVRFGIPSEKSVVIGNTFDFGRLARYRPNIDPKILGLVGSVPQSKRLDLALDIIEGLGGTNAEFRLDIQGKEYLEYPWLLNRENERKYFEEQYERIAESDFLKGSVGFGGHNPNIAEWYSSVPGFILSTSDHEGTHQAIAEGGAAGCVPIIMPWPGAEMVYGDRWLVESVEDAIQRIRALNDDPDKFREESFAIRNYVRRNFSPNVVAKQIVEIIES